MIEKKDFFTLSKQLIEMHYDPKYKNSNNYTEKSKIQNFESFLRIIFLCLHEIEKGFLILKRQ